MTKNKTFPDFLIRWRGKVNLSRRALSMKVGASATYLHKLEKGTTVPTQKMINKIADVCNISYDERLSLYEAMGIIPDELTPNLCKKKIWEKVFVGEI